METTAAEDSIRHTILLVSTSPLYGGAESYYTKLARLLLSSYSIVAVVCNMRLADELRLMGIETRYAENSWKISSLRRYHFTISACLYMVRHHCPVVAHLNGQSESYLAGFLRLLGLRVLTTRHTPFTTRYLQEGSRTPVFFKRWMVLLSLRLADQTICVSQLIRDQLAHYLPHTRLSHIPTWVDDAFFESYERPRPSTPLKLLFVGRVVRNKGIFDAIEAVRNCPQIHLTVVGEGSEMEEARKLASGLRVSFLGFQQDCKSIYRASDLLIFPSPEGFEGLPQVPLEAMAMGLPCLASNISSIREIAGSSGALVTYRQESFNDLVTHLSALSTNVDRLSWLGKMGRTEAKRRFTASSVAAHYQRSFKLSFDMCNTR